MPASTSKPRAPHGANPAYKEVKEKLLEVLSRFSDESRRAAAKSILAKLKGDVPAARGRGVASRKASAKRKAPAKRQTRRNRITPESQTANQFAA